ncbi:MAG: hypothetical protein ABI672_11855 [Vicinamibacteria bacterium]
MQGQANWAWFSRSGFRIVLSFVAPWIATGPAIAESAKPPIVLACAPGAVEVELTSKSRFHFETAIHRAVSESVVYEETFPIAGSPFDSVSITITSLGPEGGTWGRGVQAPFRVWIRVGLPKPSRTANTTFWELVADKAPENYWRAWPSLDYTPSIREVELAAVAPDPRSAPTLLELHYGADFGGVNASNWSESRVLMDFKGGTPRLLGSSVCAYNEGGGACTALDSGQLPRLTHSCSWVAEESDVRCTQSSTKLNGFAYEKSAHREFYLTKPQRPSRLPGEYETEAGAIAALINQPTEPGAMVRDTGWVSIVRDGRVPRKSGEILVGSQDAFFLVSSLGSRRPKILRAPPETTSQAPEEPQEWWTPETQWSFKARPLRATKTLEVVEIVATRMVLPVETRKVQWLGIERLGTGTIIDTIGIASDERHYAGCGTTAADQAIVALKSIRDPFLAMVRVQPHNTEGSGGDTDDLLWGGDSHPAEPEQDCIRDGAIEWISGKGFQVSTAQGDCKTTEKPQFVRIDANGKVTLTSIAER